MESSLRRAALIAAVAPLAWATTYVVTAELLPPGRPLFGAALRALPAGVALFLLRPRRPEGRWWLRASVLAACNFGLFFPLLYVGAYRLPGGLASTVQATSPLVVMTLAWLLLHERASGRRVLAALVGVAGVMLLVVDSPAQIDGVGLVGSAGSVGASALGFVLIKRWPAPVDLVTLTAWQLVIGGTMLLPLSLLVEGPPPTIDRDAMLGYAWIGVVGTAVAYLCWFHGLSKLPAGTVSLLGLLNPLTATLIGVVAAGERFQLSTGLGMTLVVSGVLAGQVAPRRPGRSSGTTRDSAEPVPAVRGRHADGSGARGPGEPRVVPGDLRRAPDPDADGGRPVELAR